MPLRARLLAGMGVVAIVLAAAAWAITRTTEAHLVDQVDRQLERAAGREFEHGFAPLRPGQERPSTIYVGVLADDALETVFAANLAGEAPAPPDVHVDQVLAAAESGEPFTVGARGSDLRYRARAAVSHLTGDVLVLALPLGDVDRTVDRLVTVEVVSTVAILAVLALVTWWVNRLGVRPVKQMTATATAIAAGDLSHRVPDVRAGTEAGDLGAALNRMLGRIEEAFDERTRSEERLRRFVADASHELRTPVATIRGYAELYRSGGLADPGALDEAMRRTEQEAVRMGALVDDLLLLARLDQGRPLARDEVDVAALVRDAALDARAVDGSRTVTADAGGRLVVLGDADRLRQVVANLVANALVHTDPGTPVALRAARDDGRAVVEVADRGRGMPPEVAARAFERFYRADASRARAAGGSGLGLAIVQAIVAAHGGEVTLDSRPGEGTTVRCALPLAPGTEDRPSPPGG